MRHVAVLIIAAYLGVFCISGNIKNVYFLQPGRILSVSLGMIDSGTSPSRTLEEDLESGTDTSGVAAQSLVLLEVDGHGSSDLSVTDPDGSRVPMETVQE